MAKYTCYNGEIINDKGINVGWIAEDISASVECLAAIKNVLETHNHSFVVGSFSSAFPARTAEPYTRENELGIHVSGHMDDMNYAYFSKEMHCNKLCANAVLKVLA